MAKNAFLALVPPCWFSQERGLLDFVSSEVQGGTVEPERATPFNLLPSVGTWMMRRYDLDTHVPWPRARELFSLWLLAGALGHCQTTK